MSPVDDDALVTTDFLRKLERLELVCRKVFLGRLKGERRSKRRGQSVEFADYRNYVVGDDLRFLDWNIYGRLEKLFIKLFLEEEDLRFHILLDGSASMAFGEPSKFCFATRVAAALGFVGLISQDCVFVHVLREEVSASSPPLRGRRSLWTLLEFLEGLAAEGPSHLNRALHRFAMAHRTPGVVVLISDFLDKHGYTEGLRYLVTRNVDLHVVHVLADDELDPPFHGDLRLVDSEDQASVDLTVNDALLQHYRQRLDAFCHHLRRWCLAHQVTYLLTPSSRPFEEIVLDHFQRAGLLR
jgi:uncharacterized protein (DUF58 family)